VLRIFWVGIPIVINLLFLIALMRAILFERNRLDAISWPLFTFVAGMIVCSCIVIDQLSRDWHWEFDNGPPAGPFSNRNTLAPMLVLAGTAILSCHQFLKLRFLKYVLPLFTAGLSLLTILTGSRNGILLLASLLWVCWWFGASIQRVMTINIITAVVIYSLLFWVPLPQSKMIRVESLSRSIGAIEKLRTGNWDDATSYRNQLWTVAGGMALKYPLLGSGPGTYYIHASQVPETRIDIVRIYGVPGIVAHSTPVNIMGEGGIPASFLWIIIWIAIPATLIMQNRIFSPAALGLFLLGLSNVFDTPWYVSGGMTISAFWFSLSLYENQNAHPQ